MENIVLISIPKSELELMIESSVRKVLNEMNFNSGKSDNDDLLTLKETAEFMNLSTATIYKYTASREIPCFKMGKRIYFKKKVLLEWINKGRLKTNSEIEQEATNYLSRRKSNTNRW